MKDSILILSGGVDSTTMLYDYKDRIAMAISFDYGSNHNAREIPFARMHCERLGIRHITIPLQFMATYFRSSLLSGADSIPEGHYADENMKWCLSATASCCLSLWAWLRATTCSM